MIAATAAMQRFVADAEDVHASASGAGGAVCRCARCGSKYDTDAWRALANIRTLRGSDVDPYVLAWPQGSVIEVRSCRTCGSAMARTVRA